MRTNESYYDKLFQIQMESWLEFAWSNKGEDRYKSYQGVRERLSGYTAPIGNINKRVNKTGLKTAINTHFLYQDWKKRQKELADLIGYFYRCYISYQEAVNEMHSFFDYMEDFGFEVLE